MALPTSIPEEFYSLFWDVDLKAVNPAKKPYFVIQRMLDRGNTRAVRWVEANFGKDKIRETFKNLRDFRPKVGLFWSLVLNIDPKEMLCLQPSYRTRRKTVWPY
jgi:hypothetical protein